MSKIPHFVVSIALIGISLCAIAQSGLEKAFQSACQLNDRREYLRAAEEFVKVQDMALQMGDYDLYMSSVTAEGECYYMLNIVSDLNHVLDKARKAYALYRSTVNEPTRLRWQEAIAKLEGSYFYCMTDADKSAYAKAENAYHQCFNIIDSMEILPGVDDEEMRLVVHRELLSLYYKQHLYGKALAEAEEVYYFYMDLGYESGSNNPVVQRNNNGFVDACLSYAMTLARLQRFEQAEGILSALPPDCDKIPSVLRTKGKILMMRYDADGTDQRDKALDHYRRYINLQQQRLDSQITNMNEIQREQFWLNMHDFLFDCYRLGDYAPEMLYDLALFSKGYLLEYGSGHKKHYTWKDIQKSLDEQSCAIEFVQYNGKNDDKYLAAIVVTKHSKKPVFVQIASLDSLKALKLNGRITLAQALVSTYGADKNAIYNDPYLPKMIWSDQLMEATKGAQKIYFAADGMLQQLAVEYMLPDSSRSCRRLTSTRVLMTQSRPTDSRKILFFGDIDYSARQQFISTGNDELAYTFLRPYSFSLVNLPGTKSEIDSISDSRQSKWDVKMTGGDASDSAFSSMANRFPIVHVATHGYFVGSLEDGTDMKPLYNDNTMSQSGLVFSGARYALRDTTRQETSPDGLLSAKELALIPMDSVELVVLSACQTGLGYITADGVYGIQRALKQAGVKAMIVSLWSVDDQATSILMKNFYKNLENTPTDVYGAFMKARKQLMTMEKKNLFDAGSMSSRKKFRYAAPQYANAFVLIDIK